MWGSLRLAPITRNLGQHVWVGYDSQTHGLVLHPNCPFQYCVNDTVVFPLNNTDVQCAFNRSGLLCGHCKRGYSLVLGILLNAKCVYQQPSTVAYSFWPDQWEYSTGLLASCLQTDSRVANVKNQSSDFEQLIPCA